MWAISKKKFEEYLLGAKFTVLTYNSLGYVQTAKLWADEHCWASHLALFDFEIKYHPGTVNQNADALSQQPDLPVPTSIEEVAPSVAAPCLRYSPQAEFHCSGIISMIDLSKISYVPKKQIC